VVAPSSAAGPGPRGALAGARAQRPFWPRTAPAEPGPACGHRGPARPGPPPAAVEDLAAGEPGDLAPTGPPVCPSCGRRHEAPGELRPSPMARPLFAGTGDSAALTRDGFRPPGWGRARGRCP
jgi:hypothetical protein